VSKYWSECARDNVTWKRHKDRVLRELPDLANMFKQYEIWYAFKQFLLCDITEKAMDECEKTGTFIDSCCGYHSSVVVCYLDNLFYTENNEFKLMYVYNGMLKRQLLYIGGLRDEQRKWISCVLGSSVDMIGNIYVRDFFIPFNHLVRDKEHKTPKDFRNNLQTCIKNRLIGS
jgi:hypothetical protein